ncbi:MAG: hypothetical protein N2Z57_02430 [Oscillospiraceae bacterium]|nr:hypothetical protein [Oscillospiraceae bacterium]
MINQSIRTSPKTNFSKKFLTQIACEILLIPWLIAFRSWFVIYDNTWFSNMLWNAPDIISYFAIFLMTIIGTFLLMQAINLKKIAWRYALPALISAGMLLYMLFGILISVEEKEFIANYGTYILNIFKFWVFSAAGAVISIIFITLFDKGKRKI